jgi:tetratricopeptide (TPR) repeat protein
VYPKAVQAAQRAIVLDSTIAEAWAIAALLNTNYEWDWPRARREIDRAIALNKSNSTAYLADAAYWMGMRRADRAVASTRKSIELDPLNPAYRWFLTPILYLSAAPDSVMAAQREVDRLAPGFVYLDSYTGLALADLGRKEAAESTFKAAEVFLGHRSAFLARFYAQNGRTAEARAIIQELVRNWPKTYVAPELIATAYDALGDTENYYRWEERGVEVHSALTVFNALWIGNRKHLAEPRFQKILRATGIPSQPAP